MHPAQPASPSEAAVDPAPAAISLRAEVGRQVEGTLRRLERRRSGFGRLPSRGFPWA
jgi:hypothetical protein